MLPTISPFQSENQNHLKSLAIEFAKPTRKTIFVSALIIVLSFGLLSCKSDKQKAAGPVDDFYPIDQVLVYHRNTDGALVQDQQLRVENTVASSILRLQKLNKPVETQSSVSLRVDSQCAQGAQTREHQYLSTLTSDLRVSQLVHPDFLVDLTHQIESNWVCDFVFTATNQIGSVQRFRLEKVNLLSSPRLFATRWVDEEELGIFNFARTTGWSILSGSPTDPAQLNSEVQLKFRGQLTAADENVRMITSSHCERDGVSRSADHEKKLKGRIALAEVLDAAFLFDYEVAPRKSWLCEIAFELKHLQNGATQNFTLPRFWFEPSADSGLAIVAQNGSFGSGGATAMKTIRLNEVENFSVLTSGEILSTELSCLDGNSKLQIVSGKSVELASLKSVKDASPGFIKESPLQICRLIFTTRSDRNLASRVDQGQVQAEFSELFEIDFDPEKKSLSAITPRDLKSSYPAVKAKKRRRGVAFYEVSIVNTFSSERTYKIELSEPRPQVVRTPFRSGSWPRPNSTTRSNIKAAEQRSDLKYWISLDGAELSEIALDDLRSLRLAPGQQARIQFGLALETGCFFYEYDHAFKVGDSHTYLEDGWILTWPRLSLSEFAASYRGAVEVGRLNLETSETVILPRRLSSGESFSVQFDWVLQNYQSNVFGLKNYACEVPPYTPPPTPPGMIRTNRAPD